MTSLPLNNNFSFDIKMHNGRPRIIIYDRAEEYVCRKESFSNLEKFITSPSAHIFRGRLQLLISLINAVWLQGFLNPPETADSIIPK